MADTSIEWTSKVWNPSTGCDRVSPGCDHCYALTLAKRLKGMGSAKYQTDGDPRTSGPGFGLATHQDALTVPLRWRTPQRVFVNSMSDLFHDRVPDEFIAAVFVVMAATPQHTYQVLTKRHGRMRSLLSSPRFQMLAGAAAFDWIQEHKRPVGWNWPVRNVHLGVSVENEHWARIRIPALRETPAAVRFLSAEPLLGPLGDVDLTGIGWVIVGGESGPGARPMDLDWARSLVHQCREAGVPMFVKQLGSVWARDTCVNGDRVGRTDPKGGEPHYWPRVLRVREYPAVATHA